MRGLRAAVLLRGVADAKLSDFVCDGTLQETVPCGTSECSVDKDCMAVNGEWNHWEEWTTCDCASFTRTRTRSVAVHAACDGVPLSGPLQQSETCDGGEPCAVDLPIDCALSIWNPWTECECGVTQVYRTRLLETWAEKCGTACDGNLKETKECDQTKVKDCEDKIDCKYEEWEEWSHCSRTCGGGQQERSRAIKWDASNGGAGCGDSLKEVKPCNSECCGDTGPIDCKYEKWGDWSGCSVSCGGGYHTRSREVETYPENGGALCELANLEEIGECNTEKCLGAEEKVDGRWNNWLEWSECSQTCGGGYLSRHRTLAQQAEHGGEAAVGPFSEWHRCSMQSCPGEGAVDCVMGDWGDWDDCSTGCTGIQKALRLVVTHGSGGGEVCEGGLQKVRPCNLPGDPGSTCSTSEHEECSWNQWAEWSECSAKCLGGIQVRSRTFPGEAKVGDDMDVAMPTTSTGVCEGPVEELRACNTFQCYMVGDPVDCVWEEWGKWSDCSVSCGDGGEKARYRTIKTYPKFGGSPCSGENSVEVASCNDHPCLETRHCNWSEWAPWSACSVSCGGGQTTRVKRLEVQNGTLGEVEGSLVNSMDQNLIELRKGVEELRLQRKTRTAGLAGAAALGAVAVALVARSRSPMQSFELVGSAD